MHLFNALLVLITGAIASAAVIPDTHIKIEELKDPKEVIAHEPITIHPAGMLRKIGPNTIKELQESKQAVAQTLITIHPTGVVPYFNFCGGNGHVVEVRLTNCTPTDYCSIQAETDAKLEIDFVLASDLYSLTTILYGFSDHAVILVNDTSPVEGSGGFIFKASIPFSLHDTDISAISGVLLGVDKTEKDWRMACVTVDVQVLASGQLVLQGGEL